MSPRKIEFIRKIIIITVILYAVFPDLFIGPFDDVLFIIMGSVAYYALGVAKDRSNYAYQSQ